MMITKILLIIKALFTARKFWRGRHGRRCGNCRHWLKYNDRIFSGRCLAHPKQALASGLWQYPNHDGDETCGEWA